MQSRGLMREPAETDGSRKPRARPSLREGAGDRRTQEGRGGQGSAHLREEAPGQGEGEAPRGAGARSTLGQEERARAGGMKPGEETGERDS